MKNAKIVLAILPFLVCALLFSVGFSTWTLAVPSEVSAETSFSVSVAPIYKADEFISVTKMDMFKYSSLHFVDSNGAPSDVGSLVVSCEVDLDACREALGSKWNGALSVRIDLLYSNLCLEDGESYNLFQEISGEYQKSMGANLIVGDTKTACSLTNGGSYVSVTATVNPGTAATGTYSFGLEFAFNVPMNKPNTEIPSNFRHVFGKYLKNKPNDKTDFIVTARITEI
ncbi:MAG: hypothetical protein J6V09_05450 [Clostridia bacterium]|nr:hypothetical protein [Clostridia bacterium]